MFQEQVAARMAVSVARVSQIEGGDLSTQEVLNRFVGALGRTLKLIADFLNLRRSARLWADPAAMARRAGSQVGSPSAWLLS